MAQVAESRQPAARVALLGGESSGKTTLAAALAMHYRTLWVAEYLREFTVDQGRTPPAYRPRRRRYP